MDNKKELTIEEITFLICGKEFENAKETLQKHSYLIRIAKKDGRRHMLTMDYRSNRVNVEVNNDIVATVMGIG